MKSSKTGPIAFLSILIGTLDGLLAHYIDPGTAYFLIVIPMVCVTFAGAMLGDE
jgi:hypothetical protein